MRIVEDSVLFGTILLEVYSFLTAALDQLEIENFRILTSKFYHNFK